MGDGNLAARLDEDNRYEAGLTDERLNTGEKAFRIVYGNRVDLLLGYAELLQIRDRVAGVEQEGVGVHLFAL